jgi:hypothetical protein
MGMWGLDPMDSRLLQRVRRLQIECVVVLGHGARAFDEVVCDLRQSGDFGSREHFL